jgi:hypothetical protein
MELSMDEPLVQMKLLVATNVFFSSSRTLQVAEMFCGLDPNTGILPSRSRDNERQYALSEIDIDCTQSSNTILVDITAQNIFPHANEILFDTGTTFEIISVNYDCKHYFWHIHMKTSSKIVELNQQYEHYIDQQMKETNVNVFFGMLLTDLGDLYSIIELLRASFSTNVF